MKNDFDRGYVSNTIDQVLSNVQGNPDLANQIITTPNIRKPRQKMSYTLLIIVLLLTCGSIALAVSLSWKEYAPVIKENENQYGYYAEWPDTLKIELVTTLCEMGYIAQDILPINTASQADLIMLDYVGVSRIEDINLNEIAEAIYGNNNTWSYEDRWWFLGVLLGDDRRDTEYSDRPVTNRAQEDLITESQAMMIAEAVAKECEIEVIINGNCISVTDLYTTTQRPDMERWSIRFMQFDSQDPDTLIHTWNIIIDAHTGEVIGDPDIEQPSIYEIVAMEQEAKVRSEEPDTALYIAFSARNEGIPFYLWPYEEKALYSAQYAELTDLDDSAPYDVSMSTVYRYGMPKSSEIDYDCAVEIATNQYHGFAPNQVHSIRICASYDITNPDMPKWKMMLINGDDWFADRYLVIISGIDGHIIQQQSVEWKEFCQDLSYDLLYY